MAASNSSSESFFAALQNRSVKRVYTSEVPADHGAGMPYKKSFLNIGLHQVEDNAKTYIMWGDSFDVCIFDYFIFDKASRQKILADYNLLIANDMLKRGSQKVFENDVVIILKNNKVGGDCIEERSF